jgi:hypothetical protein
MELILGRGGREDHRKKSHPALKVHILRNVAESIAYVVVYSVPGIDFSSHNRPKMPTLVITGKFLRLFI